MVYSITTLVNKQKNMKYQSILEELGLAQNEAKIYETLLQNGEMAVGTIAEKSGIHRRNVYDSLRRLIEKGLVFEILETKNIRYQATDPGRFSELLDEKKQKLDAILPDLSALYENVPNPEALFLYRGVEGWKNYLSDVLLCKKELRIIAAVDKIQDPRTEQFMKQYYVEMKRKNIPAKVLFRHDTKTKNGKAEGPLAEIAEYRILPKEYPIGAGIGIFSDRTAIFTDTVSQEKIENETTITFIKNKNIADSMRLIFDALWLISKK